jgi:hypothetical protein
MVFSDIVIAYEPVWAIGTGLTAVSTPFRPPFSTHLVPAGLPTLSPPYRACCHAAIYPPYFYLPSLLLTQQLNNKNNHILRLGNATTFRPLNKLKKSTPRSENGWPARSPKRSLTRSGSSTVEASTARTAESWVSPGLLLFFRLSAKGRMNVGLIVFLLFLLFYFYLIYAGLVAKEADIDGFLVGGASIKPEFIDICKAAE